MSQEHTPPPPDPTPDALEAECMEEGERLAGAYIMGKFGSKPKIQTDKSGVLTATFTMSELGRFAGRAYQAGVSQGIQSTVQAMATETRK